MNNQITARDHSAMVRNSANGQYPKAVILSCLDSRIPVEDVFDKGIGDLFVARVAGNIVNEDILGSMEYGCKVSGAKLILVLGHQSCCMAGRTACLLESFLVGVGWSCQYEQKPSSNTQQRDCFNHGKTPQKMHASAA